MKKIFIMILLLILSSGCFNYKEINNLAIIPTIGIEKKDNNYIVTAWIINTKKENSNKVITYKGKGKDIDGALKDIANMSSKELFLSHLKVLIISDDLIKNNITDVIDYFARNTQAKMNFYVITSTTNTPSEILNITPPLDTLPSNDIYNLLNISDKLKGNVNILTFENLIKQILEKGVNPVYTNISVINNKKNINKIKVNNMVSFDKKNNITLLDEDESLGYNLINNNIKNPIITSKCKNENNYFSIEIIKSKNKIKYKNNKIYMNFKIKGTISEINCNKDVNSIKTRKELNEITTREINKKINKTINKAKKSKNDFIGLGNILYKNNRKINNDWDKEKLNNLEIITKVDLQIIKEGKIEKNIKDSEYYE